MATLHVTNGDEAARDLARLGRVVAWRDVLHEGPVPAQPPDALRATRAAFLAGAGLADRATAEAQLAERDRVLAAADFSTPVVLWFEDDLYDQLQLLQVLDRLAERNGPVQLAHLPRGPRTFLEHRLAAARSLDEHEQDLGQELWRAFCAGDVGGLQERWLRGTPGLPDVAPALERLLEELPATSDGLARSERQVLRAVAAGPLALESLLATVTAAEERPYLGDAVLRWRAGRLAPLVEDRGGAFAITATGRAVLDGETGALDHLHLDRWLGGLHLEGADPPWRWDPATRRAVGPGR